ncbi:aromatic acid/H+ symport family MFS transporter [Bacillus sp. AFS076308]|uniref:MFS transporter n=1 Tax=unclassified Bacillus (in: firmicutes) TaxID=185979 RepID=UPI000BFA35BD|nr:MULTISPECIES: aromatic acid/H+ symport family MFS transporter [unclassified Bacillus (in: firmicutes)]PFO08961.1 aromatic acid/H+ symport family MFS transporter [Bacillus sp. AFS076308]PGV52465.1 aromatic acid/H+ symport family MFS transporter [Bacillus sp. AFS037270]
MSNHSIKNILDESKFNRFHLGLLLWCLLFVSFEGYDLVVYGSVVPFLTKEWNLSPIEAGVIGSYGLFGMMFGSIILSLLADRFGRKSIIIVSVTFFSIFTTISGFATDAQLFSWCRFLAGVGFGGTLPTVISLLTEYIPKSSKNKSITIALCGNQVGGILAPLIGVLVFALLGWRPVLWFSAIPLLLIPLIIRYLPESPQFLIRKGKLDILRATLTKIDPNYHDRLMAEQTKISEPPVVRTPIIGLFKNKMGLSTILFCIVYFMGLLMIYGLNTWLPKLMQSAGYPLISSLGFAIFLNGGALIGTIIIGVIADRKGSKKLITGLYVLGAICLALLGIKSNIFLLYLLIAIAGVCTMGNQSLLNAFVSQYYPNNVRSTGVGLANGVGRLGGMLGPTLGGVLLSMNVPIGLCFLVFALPGIFAALALFLVRKTIHKQEPTSTINTELKIN